MRAAEKECIELHKGAEDQHVLVRRGIGSNAEVPVSPEKPSDYTWPSFEDDD
jgi:hypothetical protein